MHPIPLPGTKMRARIKDPGLDPVIAMTRDRRKKELQTEAQALVVSGLTGAVLHKMLELKTVERDIKELEEGVQEYQDQIDLLNERKRDIQKSQVEKAAWCETFDRLIGPFEAKYEECKAEVKVSFDYAKTKYHESLQKLIEDFGFNPTYKVSALANVLDPPPPAREGPGAELAAFASLSCALSQRWFDEF